MTTYIRSQDFVPECLCFHLERRRRKCCRCYLEGPCFSDVSPFLARKQPDTPAFSGALNPGFLAPGRKKNEGFAPFFFRKQPETSGMVPGIHRRFPVLLFRCSPSSPVLKDRGSLRTNKKKTRASPRCFAGNSRNLSGWCRKYTDKLRYFFSGVLLGYGDLA